MKQRLLLLPAVGVLVALGALFLAKETGQCRPRAVADGRWPVTAAGNDIRRVQANGIDFAYVEAGSGPLVLLLHGYPETPAVWAKALAVLAQAGYHAVAPYMRGYPPSGAPANGDYSITALGKDALALVAALGYRRAIIIGHDWGTSAGLAAAVRSPQAIEKVVAVSIPHPIALEGDPTALWKASHFLEYQLPFMAWWLTTKELCHVDAIYARWAPGWEPPQAVLDSVKQSLRTDDGLRHALGYYWSFFSSGAAEPGDLSAKSLISVPTLAIGGANDGGIDISRFKLSRQGFVGPYEFVAFDKSGHFPEMEEAERFDSEVLRFLGRPRP
jgi:pimeloyl-ACP methyl ester carboxylesterase